MALRIVRGAAPVHSADIAGEDQRALQTGRGENLSGSRGLDFVRAPLLLLSIFPPGILGRQFLRNQGNGRSRLRRPGLLAGNIALRDRALLDGQERRARQPVQDEHSPHLRRDGDRRRPVFPGEQRRLRRYVIIPDVVMHHLKSPHEFTSARAQGHHRIRPLVVALSEAPEIIRARAPRWNENHVAFGIHRNRGPRIARAGPRLRFRRPGDGIPCPTEFSASRVERANDAALEGDCAIVADRGARDDQVLEDGRSRSDLVVARVAQFYAAREVDLAVRSKVGAGLSGGTVQGDQTCIKCPDENSQGARFTSLGTRFSPGRYAARGDFRRAVGQLKLGVKFPKLRASFRIQGDHVIVWSAQKEFSVSEDGRSLKRSFLVEFRIMRQRAGAIGPRGFELGNICAVDLRCRGVARPAAIVAVVGPARVRLSLRKRVGCQPQEKQNRNNGE